MSLIEVRAFRLVCDRCGEHDGEHHDSPHLLISDMLPEGWTHEDGIVCITCHQETREMDCAASDDGHEWGSAMNRNLATMWAGEPEFILRHCDRDCGRTEMRRRDTEWLGFDRYGWLGDSAIARQERCDLRTRMFRISRQERV